MSTNRNLKVQHAAELADRMLLNSLITELGDLEESFSRVKALIEVIRARNIPG
jgi:hypothetical protein